MESKGKKVASSMSYDEVKKQAIANPLVRILVRLSELRIIAANIVSYKGNTLHFTEDAFTALARLIGVTLSTQDRVGTLMGDQAKIHFMNTMREAMSAHKNKQIMLIGNPSNFTIVGVIKDSGMLSTESFFELAEGIINKYDLQVGHCSIGRFGEVAITTTSPKTALIKGLDPSYKTDESFKPGLSFHNSVFDGTALNPYTVRQVCSNGMVAVDKNAIIRIGGFDSKELQEFYGRVKSLANNNFIDFNYNANVVRATQTLASMGELQYAFNAISRSSTISPVAANALVPYLECVEKYGKMGYKVEDFSKQQLQNAKTHMPLWNVVNAMTDFASHTFDNVEIAGDARIRVQELAGALLNKPKYDTQNLVPSLV